MNRKAIKAKTDGKCYYCGCKLLKRWHVDHIVPLYRNDTAEQVAKMGRVKGTDDIDNLVPSCPRCNIRKSTLTIEKFRHEIQAQVDRLQRDSTAFRMALDFGLIEITDKPVQFYFEQLTGE